MTACRQCWQLRPSCGRSTSSEPALLTLNESDVRLVLARMPTLDCLILGPRPDSYPPDDFPQQPPAVIELLRGSKPGLSLRLGTGEGSEDEYDWW